MKKNYEDWNVKMSMINIFKKIQKREFHHRIRISGKNKNSGTDK